VKTQLEYMIIKLEEILVSSVSTGGSGGEDRLTENVVLNFAKVDVEYTQQNAQAEPAPSPRWAGTFRRTPRGRERGPTC